MTYLIALLLLFICVAGMGLGLLVRKQSSEEDAPWIRTNAPAAKTTLILPIARTKPKLIHIFN